MLLKKMLASVALIPLALCAPLGASNQVMAQSTEAAVGTTTAMDDADPALWVVKDADTTVYLFGTVHMLKPGLSWFDEAVKDAFDKSDTLVIEVILPEDQNEIASRTIPLAVDQTGKTISSQLTDGQRTAYEAQMSKYGLPVGQFDIFEPWFPGLTLASVALLADGYKPELGSEKILTSAAKEAKKPITALESLDQQLGFFDGLPREDQLKFLVDTIEQLPTGSAEFSEMLFAWARGNPDELGQRMNRSMQGSEKMASTLLYERNERWADWIKTRLDQPGTIFVAVGAGHLAGPKSVQDYLTAKGLSAERITY